MEPRIQYAKTEDGVNIAYLTAGQGLPLVWIHSVVASSMEQEWKVPFWRRFYDPLLPYRTLVRFDSRGLGLSDRDVADLSLEGQVMDVEAVVDSLGIERFALLGFARGGQVAIAYAARHPDHVSHLLLVDAFARGSDFLARPEVETLVDLAARNWEMYTENVGGVNLGWDREEARQLSALIRESVNQETALALYEETGKADVSELLTSIEAPTLVFRHGSLATMTLEMSKELATSIPNATLTVVEGKFADSGEARARAVLEFLGEDLPRPDDHGTAGRSGAELPAIEEFLTGKEPSPATPHVDADMYTILFTDMESSTALTRTLGDVKAQELIRAHNIIVREALSAHDGTEIKHTGDGIMASFPTASSALGCAVAIQQAVAARADERPEVPLGLRIGLNAGEPVAEEQDLFGTSVQLARRICDHADPGQIVASNVVRELASGKGFLFGDIGEVVPKGFEEPVRLYEVRWQD